MAVKTILLLGNPFLRQRCKPAKNFSSRSTSATMKNLSDTLEDFRSRHAFGRGITAPQIGSNARIIFIGLNGLGALVNPKIIKRGKKKIELWDDCFSFPDILVRVRRHTWVEVSYQDKTGAWKKLKATNGLSELLQHEIDHINGILAIDRAISKKHIILRSQFGPSP
ncbi:MAG: peptide deformylase [Bacteroidota bacterium]